MAKKNEAEVSELMTIRLGVCNECKELHVQIIRTRDQFRPRNEEDHKTLTGLLVSALSLWKEYKETGKVADQ